MIAVESIPVKAAPLPTKLVAVMTPAFPNFILLPTSKKSSTSTAGAVIIPTESILVTSSYVNVPPMDTLPVKFALVAVITPAKLPPILSKGPENFVAVIIPLDFILWLRTLLKV